MSQEPPPERDKAHWTGISIVLFVLGLMILVPSGLCTVGFGVFLVVSGNFFAGNTGIVRAFLLYGCIAMALGAALVYGAFESRRRD